MNNIKAIIKKVNQDNNHQTRILNATSIILNEDIKKYDFFCSLVYGNNNMPFCGGNYIGNKLVISAAHCVDQIIDKNNLKIIFHKQNVYSTGTKYNVKKILIHPQYDKSTSDNDIAIIYLEEEPEVQAIYLPTPYLLKNNIYNIGGKDDCIIIGFGKTSMNSNMSYYLKKALIGLLDIENTKYPSNYISDNMIIAGDFNNPTILDDNEDTCQGDSGGPLFKEIIYENKIYHILIGLTSWGYGCGLENYGGVYTKCSQYIKWIKEKLDF